MRTFGPSRLQYGISGSGGSSDLQAPGALAATIAGTPGEVYTVPTFTLKQPVTFTLDNSNTTRFIDPDTGVVTLTDGLSPGQVEVLTGRVTGADGLSTPFTVTLTAQYAIGLSTNFCLTTVTAGTAVSPITGVPPGVVPVYANSDSLFVIGGSEESGWHLDRGTGTLAEGAFPVTITAAGAIPYVGSISISVPTIVLQPLTLANPFVNENTAAGTTISAVNGAQSGSTLALTNAAGNQFAMTGSTLKTGATNIDYEDAAYPSHTREIDVTETNGALTRVTTLTIQIGDVNESTTNTRIAAVHGEFSTVYTATKTNASSTLVWGTSGGACDPVTGAPTGADFVAVSPAQTGTTYTRTLDNAYAAFVICKETKPDTSILYSNKIRTPRGQVGMNWNSSAIYDSDMFQADLAQYDRWYQVATGGAVTVIDLPYSDKGNLVDIPAGITKLQKGLQYPFNGEIGAGVTCHGHWEGTADVISIVATSSTYMKNLVVDIPSKTFSYTGTGPPKRLYTSSPRLQFTVADSTGSPRSLKVHVFDAYGSDYNPATKIWTKTIHQAAIDDMYCLADLRSMDLNATNNTWICDYDSAPGETYWSIPASDIPVNFANTGAKTGYGEIVPSSNANVSINTKQYFSDAELAVPYLPNNHWFGLKAREVSLTVNINQSANSVTVSAAPTKDIVVNLVAGATWGDMRTLFRSGASSGTKLASMMLDIVIGVTAGDVPIGNQTAIAIPKTYFTSAGHMRGVGLPPLALNECWHRSGVPLHINFPMWASKEYCIAYLTLVFNGGTDENGIVYPPIPIDADAFIIEKGNEPWNSAFKAYFSISAFGKILANNPNRSEDVQVTFSRYFGPQMAAIQAVFGNRVKPAANVQMGSAASLKGVETGLAEVNQRGVMKILCQAPYVNTPGPGKLPSANPDDWPAATYASIDKIMEELADARDYCDRNGWELKLYESGWQYDFQEGRTLDFVAWWHDDKLKPLTNYHVGEWMRILKPGMPGSWFNHAGKHYSGIIEGWQVKEYIGQPLADSPTYEQLYLSSMKRQIEPYFGKTKWFAGAYKNPGLPTVSGPRQVGGPLILQITAYYATSISVQLYRDGVVAGDPVVKTGAYSTAGLSFNPWYTQTSADLGKDVSFVVTATGPYGSISYTIASTGLTLAAEADYPETTALIAATTDVFSGPDKYAANALLGVMRSTSRWAAGGNFVVGRLATGKTFATAKLNWRTATTVVTAQPGSVYSPTRGFVATGVAGQGFTLPAPATTGAGFADISTMTWFDQSTNSGNAGVTKEDGGSGNLWRVANTSSVAARANESGGRGKVFSKNDSNSNSIAMVRTGANGHYFFNGIWFDTKGGLATTGTLQPERMGIYTAALGADGEPDSAVSADIMGPAFTDATSAADPTRGDIYKLHNAMHAFWDLMDLIQIKETEIIASSPPGTLDLSSVENSGFNLLLGVY